MTDPDAPIIVDLYSGAGGAAKGYMDAGFRVLGVDLNPQPNYPGWMFVQADALEFMAMVSTVLEVAAYHASPPCQTFSQMSACRPGLADLYPDLVAPTRDALESTGLPYVIENVPGSPVRPDITLCGQMFGLDLYRHRLFESNIPLTAPPHPKHIVPASKAGHWKPGTVMSVSGHVSPIAHARKVMGGIDWMTRDELAEAIPPQYTNHIGAQLFTHLAARAAA